jgi:hypothetical protein
MDCPHCGTEIKLGSTKCKFCTGDIGYEKPKDAINFFGGRLNTLLFFAAGFYIMYYLLGIWLLDSVNHTFIFWLSVGSSFYSVFVGKTVKK